MSYSEDEYDNKKYEGLNRPALSKAELRKTNKPIMEKKRRARINNCLNELKDLLMEAMKKDPARHSKLEKADILEMTVKHLQAVQRQQLAAAVAADPTVLMRFRAGFGDCATEVRRYMSRLHDVPAGVRGRLANHLNSCLTGLERLAPPLGFPVPPQANEPYEQYDRRRSSAFQYVRRPFSPPLSPNSCDSSCDSSTEPETPPRTQPVMLPPHHRTFPTPPSKSNSDQDSSPETQKPTVSSTTISPDNRITLCATATKPNYVEPLSIVIDIDHYESSLTPVKPKDYSMGPRNTLKRKSVISVNEEVSPKRQKSGAGSGSAPSRVSTSKEQVEADTSTRSPEQPKPSDGMWRPW